MDKIYKLIDFTADLTVHRMLIVIVKRIGRSLNVRQFVLIMHRGMLKSHKIPERVILAFAMAGVIL